MCLGCNNDPDGFICGECKHLGLKGCIVDLKLIEEKKDEGFDTVVKTVCDAGFEKIDDMCYQGCPSGTVAYDTMCKSSF